METTKLNAVIGLLEKITLDINSVEVKLIGELTPLGERCKKLWMDAYTIRREFEKMREAQNIESQKALES